MHRQRKILPAVRHACSQSRSVVTAAKLKSNGPRQGVDSVASVNLEKWARPTPLHRPTSSNTTWSSDPSLSLQHSPLSVPASNARNRATPFASSIDKGAKVLPTPKAWAKSPPTSNVRQQGSNKAATPTNIGKWARPSPSRSQAERSRTEPPASPLRTTPSSAQKFRFQRDAAPHESTSRASLHQRTTNNFSKGDHDRRPATAQLQISNRSVSRTQDCQQLRETPQGSNVQIPDSVESEPESSSRNRRGRDAFKQRGSLLNATPDQTPFSHRTKNMAERAGMALSKKSKKPMEIRARADVCIPTTVSVGQLARLLNIRLDRLQSKMKRSGMADEASYDHVLTSDYAVLLAEEFGRNAIINDEAAFDLHPPTSHPEPSTLPSRPPVVTIMGHVDHGKTTLLDTLRSSSIAKGEAGGITQHIGAFSVPVPGATGEGPRSITFLDTPGHAAFSAMRARGAGVTDIVVLVVAADDGIMPQTREVINLVKQDTGSIGLVVAVNKVDKPDADTESVEHALLSEGIQLEVFGGDIPSVHVSGLTGQGLPNLVETLSVMAEMQDLRAERDGPVYGHILESKMQKGLGPVATVLISRGCLKPGSHIISGVSQAKVRAMTDTSGLTVKAAYPGMAVTVSGWKSIPKAGDDVIQGSENDVKKALTNRIRQAAIDTTLADIDAINASRRHERETRELDPESEPKKSTDNVGPKELRLIIKADVSGSAEAVQGALQGIGNKEAMTKIVSFGVGDISESDVMMAKAANATVIGFSVACPRAIETLAIQNEVPIYVSTIIYRLMEEVQNRVVSLLPVITETKVIGEATVLQLFTIQVKNKQSITVAGSRVINGVLEKVKFARVVRDGNIIHEGSLDTMRHLKKDVTEIRKGSECGLSLAQFSDLREGDLIQMYEKIEKPGIL